MILAPQSFPLLRWLALVLLAGVLPAYGLALPLEKLNLPDGYRIKVWAEVINPRQLARNPDGVVFAGSRRAGNVYALIDKDGDHLAETEIIIDSGLTQPTGVTYFEGNLYVGSINKLLVYRNIDSSLSAPPDPEIIYEQLPKERHHGWKFIDFGPDGNLYFNVGAPCNVCLKNDPRYASIMRINPSEGIPEVYAHGVRNTVGFTWHPLTGELWFTDNGRDRLGDEVPPCELNVAERPGLHFGYPFVHGQDILDPKFGKGKVAADYTPPALDLGAHVAPLGLIFYRGDMLPENLKNQVLIAEHGSWNRSAKAGHVGYRISVARRLDNGGMSYEPLIDGWLQGSVGWGRPVDILELPDGSLLISDDTGDVVYRLSYSKEP